MRGGQISVVVVLTLATALSGSNAAQVSGRPASLAFGQCIGDCGHDGRVTIDELLLGVRIALEQTPPDACPEGGPGYFSLDALVTAVRNALAGCTTVQDLSGFAEFVYELTPSYGFCPEIGAVDRAVIDRHGDTYVLERSIIDTGTPGGDDCLPETLTGRPCLVARPLPCRTLTADEIQRVNKVFGQITVWTAADSFCLNGVADLCLVLEAHWDGLQTNDHVCARQSRLDSEQSAQLTALIASLGNGPQVPCDTAL